MQDDRNAPEIKRMDGVADSKNALTDDSIRSIWKGHGQDKAKLNLYLSEKADSIKDHAQKVSGLMKDAGALDKELEDFNLSTLSRISKLDEVQRFLHEDYSDDYTRRAKVNTEDPTWDVFYPVDSIYAEITAKEPS